MEGGVPVSSRGITSTPIPAGLCRANDEHLALLLCLAACASLHPVTLEKTEEKGC